MCRNPTIILRRGDQTLDQNAEVEWYSGSELYTHPRRVKVKDIWEDVFQYEKEIKENLKQQREIVFRCHIGDNRIVEIAVQTCENKG